MNDNKSNWKGYKAWLRTDDFVFVTIVAMLIPLMVHTANLLLQISMVQNVYYAYFFAFAFDLGIFLHAINGNERVSGGLAFIVFLLNLAFFNLDTFNAHANPQVVKLVISVIVAGTSAYLIHSYVEMYFHKQQKEKDDLRLWEQLKALKETAAAQAAELDRFKALEMEHEVLKAEVNAKERELSLLERQVVPVKPEPVEETNVRPLVVAEFPRKTYSCSTCGKKVVGETAYNQLVELCSRAKCPEKQKAEQLKATTAQELAMANNN